MVYSTGGSFAGSKFSPMVLGGRIIFGWVGCISAYQIVLGQIIDIIFYPIARMEFCCKILPCMGHFFQMSQFPS